MTHYAKSSVIDASVFYPEYGLFNNNTTQRQQLEYNSQSCHSDNGFGKENTLDYLKVKVRNALISYTYSRMLDQYDEQGKKICTACKQDTRYAEMTVSPGDIKSTAYLDAGLEYQARQRILSKLGDSDLTVGTTLGEGPETFSYIKDKISSLNNILTDMKDRHRRLQLMKKIPMWKPFSSLRLAGYWLEYRFAIMPLIGEIESYWNIAQDAYSTGNYNQRDNDVKKFLGFTLKAHSKKTIDIDWVKPVRFEAFGYDAQNSQTTTRQITYVTKGYISDPRVWALRQVGLYSPASIAWDLVPLSFFVDYFVPIGNMIEAASATDGYTFSESSKTITVIDRVETKIVGKSGHTYKGSTGSGSALRTRREKTRRIIASNVFSPKITDLINGAKLDLNLGQVLDTLALTRSIVFGKYK